MNHAISENSEISRRQFIASTTAMTVGMYVLPQFAIGKSGMSPNSKVNLAAVGCQGMGGVDLYNLAQIPQIHIVGLCDVDAKKLENPGLRHNIVEAPDAKRYFDFREMLHDLGDKVDAVVVGTPDHSHFPASMLAMSLGKHVYCEKPLTNEIWCVRQMINLANKKRDLVTQMGIQSHANEGLRLAKEWYEAGAIGQVKEIHVWTDRPLWPGGRQSYPTAEPVRNGFHWDLWQSYQETRPYGRGYEPFVFRAWWDFGAGALGDIACHSMDMSNYMFELSTPVKVEVLHNERGTEISPPTTSTIRFHFPAGRNHGPLTLTWYDGHMLSEEGKKQPDADTIPIWSSEAKDLRVQNLPKPPAGWPKEKPLSTNGQFIVGDKGFFYNSSMHIGTPQLLPKSRWDEFKNNRPPKTLPRATCDHRCEWVEAIIRGDPKQAQANFQYSAPLTETVLLGKLALRSGSEIVWDSKNLRVTNNEEANKYVKPSIRDGWLFGVDT